MNGRKIISVMLALALVLGCVSGCGTGGQAQQGSDVIKEEESPELSIVSEAAEDASAPAVPEEAVQEDTAEGETLIYAHIGENTLTIKPENNSSAEAFVKLLQNGDLTIEMQDYGGFEKVGSLGTDLPTNDERITTQAGDVILYQGNQITIYYDTNTWSFTRLGRVQNLSAEALRNALGEGTATVVFSLRER